MDACKLLLAVSPHGVEQAFMPAVPA